MGGATLVLFYTKHISNILALSGSSTTYNDNLNTLTFINPSVAR